MEKVQTYDTRVLKIGVCGAQSSRAQVESWLATASDAPLYTSPEFATTWIFVSLDDRLLNDATAQNFFFGVDVGVLCGNAQEISHNCLQFSARNSQDGGVPLVALVEDAPESLSYEVRARLSDVLSLQSCHSDLLSRSLLLAVERAAPKTPPSLTVVPSNTQLVLSSQSNKIEPIEVQEFDAAPMPAAWQQWQESLVTLIIDPQNGSIVDANSAALEFYGYSRSEFLNRPISDINVSPFSQIKAALQRAVTGGRERFQFRHRLADGSTRDVEVQTRPWQSGGRTLLCSQIRDVTQSPREQGGQTLSEGLKAVLIAADELLQFQDLDALLKRSVELGRERLGLERCTLFLFDRDNDLVRGTWGHDRFGRPVDQRNLSHPNIASWQQDTVPQGGRRWRLTEADYRQWDGTRSVDLGSRGWCAVTPIRSSEGALGTWHNDTAWSGRPPDATQQELVNVYCSLLGSIIQRKRAEDALRQSERRFRLMAEHATDLIVRIAPTGTILYASPSARNILDIDARELVGQSVEDWVHQSDADVAFLFSRPSDEAPDVHRREVRVRRCDGKYLWMEVVSRPVLDDAGQIVEYHATARDISVRRRAQDALRQSEERFRAFMDNTPAMTFIKDADGRYLYFNRTAEKLHGVKLSQLRGYTNFDRLPTDVARQLRDNDLQVLADGTAREFLEVIPDANGQARHWLTWKFPLRVDNGRIGVGGVAVDITERHQFEAALSDSEQRLSTVVNSAPLVLWAVDREGIFTFSQGQGLQTLGLSANQVVGRSAFEVYEDWPEVQEYVRRVLKGEEFTADVTIGDLVFQSRHKPLFDSAGELIGALGVAIDISERRHAEETLAHYTSRLENVLEIDHAIRSARSPEEIADVALGRLCQQLHCLHAAVTEFDFEANEATVLSSRGDGNRLQSGQTYPLDPIVAALQSKSSDSGQKTGNPANTNAMSPDVATYEGLIFWQKHLEDAGPDNRFKRSLPLIAQGELVGALDLQTQNGENFSDDLWTVAAEIAGQLAIAIQQARLFQQVRTGRAQLQALSRRLIQTQEAERRHLARELHDEIGQVLTAVKLNLQGIARLAQPERQLDNYTVLERVGESVEIVEHALRQVRDMSLNLRPSLLDDLGLAAALRWYVDRMTKRSTLSPQLTFDLPSQRFAPEIETACFRVAQEALTNAMRHAQAQHFDLSLQVLADALVLTIQDDGKGFDVREARERASAGSSLGLPGMEERVALAGGHFHIESTAQSGTRLRVTFPATLQLSNPLSFNR